MGEPSEVLSASIKLELPNLNNALSSLPIELFALAIRITAV